MDPVEGVEHPVVLDRIPARAIELDPAVASGVVRHRQMRDLVAGRVHQQHAVAELLDGAVLDLHIGEPGVPDPAAAALCTPSMTWPPRSSLMFAAPITSPSAGQFVRSLLDLGVLRDHLAADHRRGERRARADRQEAGDDGCQRDRRSDAPPTDVTSHGDLPSPHLVADQCYTRQGNPRVAANRLACLEGAPGSPSWPRSRRSRSAPCSPRRPRSQAKSRSPPFSRSWARSRSGALPAGG